MPDKYSHVKAKVDSGLTKNNKEVAPAEPTDTPPDSCLALTPQEVTPAAEALTAQEVASAAEAPTAEEVAQPCGISDVLVEDKFLMEAAQPAEEPAAHDVAEAAEEPATQQAEEAAEEPATQQAEEAAEEPAAQQAEEAAEEPATQQAEEAAEEPAAQQAEEAAEEPATQEVAAPQLPVYRRDDHVVCPFCNDRLSNPFNLNRHCRNVHSEHPPPETCGLSHLCHLAFENTTERFKHISSVDHSNFIGFSANKKSQCTNCPRRIAQENYAAHIISCHPL